MGKAQQAWNAQHIKGLRAISIKAKDRPCVDCNIRYPHYVMDFDHIRGEKKFHIGVAGRNKHVTVEALLEEIDKCVVVCANCHRVRTWNRSHPIGEIVDE